MKLNEKRSWAIVLCTMMMLGTLSVTPLASSDIYDNTEVNEDVAPDILAAPTSFKALGTVLQDDFDNETEGTSPPVNWNQDTGFLPERLEVDDLRSHSAPHSMLVMSKLATSAYCHSDDLGIVNDNSSFVQWMYISTDLGYYAIYTQATPGDVSTSNKVVQIGFDDGFGTMSGIPRAILYYNGAAYVYTGATWTINTWFEITIEHDFANYTFDLWKDGGIIQDDGDFYNNRASVRSMGYFAKAGLYTMWVDDVKIGSGGAAATDPDIWVSPTSFNFTVPVNGTDSDTLMIGNNGTANLIYNISCSGQVNVSIDPVAHWALDETSGTIAYDSIGSLNGNIIGATINQPGEVGTSYWFDGTGDYVEIGHADTIDFSPGEDFSAYAWIKTSSSDYGRIIEKRELPGDTAGYMMCIWNDGTLFALLDYGSWNVRVRGTVDIADGTWHHVGMRKYGNTFEAFVDGVSIGTNTSASGDFSNTDFLYVGTDCGVYWDFTGYIDDVRIYNRSVTPDEVYNGSSADWLFVSPENGSLIPSQWTNHTVTVNTTGLDPGSYQANITIESNDPDENPVIIPVSLIVYNTSQPDIWVTPTSFDFTVVQGGSDSDIMTVGNSGTTDLNYNITWNEPSSAMFLDDFDNETEGTSPPANWAEDTTFTCQNLEVDDVHASSAPHSMWIKAPVGASAVAHTDAGLFTVNDSTPMYTKLYIADDSGYYMLMTQSVDGDLVGTEAAVQLVFDDSAGWLTGTARGIGYYDGAGYVNTGYTWTKDAWFTIKIVHNFGSETFDAWYDSTQIVIGGDFRNSVSEVKSCHVLARAGLHEMWIDDVRIGGAPLPLPFTDDFDGEVESTSPPANWAEDTTYPCQNLEVDDVHASSTPHSMWIKSPAGTSGIAHTDAALFTVNDPTPMYAKLYIEDDSGYYMLITQSVDGDIDWTDLATYLVFDNNAGWLTGTARGIGYSNGAVVVNTGYTWTKDTWFTIKIVHNFGSDTFDAWYDSTQVVINGDFRNSSSEVKSYQVLAQAGLHEMWIDDVQIGSVQRLFHDDFDGEVESTPPDNWPADGLYPFTNREIDDVQSHSAPHAMWLKSQVATNGFCYHDVAFTTERITFWAYFPTTNCIRYFVNSKTAGGYIGANFLAHLYFYDDGKIYYYDGAFQDIGQTYTTGWHKIDIVCDYDNDEYDIWYDDGLIQIDAGFRNSGSSSVSLAFFVRQGSNEWWIDDVQIGDMVHNPVTWLNVMPDSGTLPSSSVTDHNVSVNTAGLDLGFYQANITIESNDPNEGTIIVPVNLTVVSVIGEPLMNITKWAPATASPGDTITYWVNYTNTGTDTAYNVVAFENYPADVTFISADPPASIGNNVWIIGDLAPGAGASINITVQVKVAASGSIVNYVDMTYDNSTGNPQPVVDDTAVTIIVPGAYMTIAKDAPTSANPGETIMYTIGYQNIGPDWAYNVWINDTYPANVAFVDANPPPTSGNDVWSIGNVPPGANGTIFINVTIDLAVTGTITNWVFLDYEDAMGIPLPQEVDMAQTFVGDPYVSITKTAPATANPGDVVDYIISYQNIGSDWAYNLTITDLYPAGVTYMGAAPAPDVPTDNVWTIVSLAPGVPGAIMITVIVNSNVSVGTVLLNNATVDYENGAGVPHMNWASANTTIIGPMMVTTKDGPATANPGEIINYTIHFNNTGTGTAEHVWINDTLPMDVIYISDTAAVSPYFVSSNIVGQALYYEFANVPPGSYSFTVTVYINPGVADGTILTNHVTCDYAPSGQQTEDWANTTVIRPVITVEKSVDMALASPGNFLTYYIWFNNTGSAMADLVWINDTLPGGVIYLSDTSMTSPTSAPFFVSRGISGQNIWFNFTNVPPGVHSFEITVQIDTGVANGTALINWVFCNYTAPNGQSLEETSDFAITLVGTGDSTPPSHSNEIPAINGWTNDPTPVISVHVTDPSGVDTGTIRLYIDGFMVFYDLAGIPDGYNVSYWHSMGFVDGQVVVCRIVANDTLGNCLDFTWTFTVDLTAPWVVWTDPWDGQQGVPLGHHIRVGFSEAMDPLWTPQGFSIFPPVNGSFWWDGNSTTTMTFDPFGLLEWNTTYYVTINVLARDLAGNNMLANYTWSFTTEDTDHYPPEHSNESPAIDGYTSVLDPTISVHVTDLSGVNTSTIKFYIQGFRIFHELTPVQDGYNVSYWHDMGFTPGDVVSCRIKAEDMLGNLLDFTWQFTVGSSFGIALHDGWNLVSFPLIPIDTSIEQVLSSISGQWDMVEYYDASDTADHWKTYATFMPPGLNDLWNLDNTMGFWLHVTNTTTLIIYGMEPTTTVIPLFTGWNMVGYPSLVNRAVEDALAGLPWDSVEVEDQNASYSVSPIGPTDIMTAGKGYWVKVTADCVWGVGYSFAPPTDVWAELCGANLTDLKITWTRSMDDGAGQFCITGYDIYHSSNFSKDGAGYLILDSVGAGVEEYMLYGWGKGDPNCYYFYVTAKSLSNEVMSPTQGGKFVYDLYQNWSLLSFPLILQNTSIPSIFTSLGNAWDYAWYYDGYEWKSYLVGRPPHVNDLWDIDHTMGFWLHVNLSMSPEFVIAGQVPRIIRIQLNTDWNMIGFPSLNPMTVGEAFIGLPYNETKADDPAIDDVTSMISLSGSDYLYTGQGYWIRVTESCTWLRFW